MISRLSGSEEEEEEGQWKLYFKLYCFLDVENVPKEGVEFAFMFEQVSYFLVCHFATFRQHLDREIQWQHLDREIQNKLLHTVDKKRYFGGCLTAPEYLDLNVNAF